MIAILIFAVRAPFCGTPIFRADYLGMSSHLNDPKYWRDRAEELRAMAENMKDEDAKAIILGCARDYDLLAERADARLRGPGNRT